MENSECHERTTATWQISQKPEPHNPISDMLSFTFGLAFHMWHSWKAFYICTTWGWIFNFWDISYESFMPSSRSMASKLPQEKS